MFFVVEEIGVVNDGVGNGIGFKIYIGKWFCGIELCS